MSANLPSDELRPELRPLVDQLIAELRKLPDDRSEERYFLTDRQDQAREVCWTILTDLGVDGLGGCRLCCS